MHYVNLFFVLAILLIIIGLIAVAVEELVNLVMDWLTNK